MNNNVPRVRYLSSPSAVRMSDEYYPLATLDHFWIRRRFEVLQRLTGDSIALATGMADVGCGHGILQRQIEDRFQRQVTGFDLNEVALTQSVSRDSPVCCYDLFQRNSEYSNQFDLVFLFDVLEHVGDERGFIEALQFHLAPRGKLVINVPALQCLWSKYDEITGHYRRYTIRTLTRVLRACGMSVRKWSYWGLLLTPVLMLRKIRVSTLSDHEVYSAGFDSGGTLLNNLLLSVSRAEPIPQHLVGSSLMVVAEMSADVSS